MSRKAFIIIIAIIVALAGYLIISGKSDNPTSNSKETTANPAKIKSDDYLAGSKDKKYVVTEYIDLACPACGQFYPTMQSLIQKYGDQVTFVIRYFPLTSVHPNALVGARAAQAAGAQGKFFEMENKLYTNQSAWISISAGSAQKTIEGYAKSIGLNMTQYDHDFVSDATLTRINEDRDLATKLGLTGTPSLFVNGKALTLNNQDDLEKAIKNILSTKQTDSNNYKKQ
jgi:protein-disulfide isomerase